MAQEQKQSIYRPSDAEVRRANEVRDRILENVAAQRDADAKTERRIMQLGQDAMLVQDRKWWLIFRSRKTRKPFHSFNQWLTEDFMGISRASVYKAMLVASQLKGLPAATVEELGKEKCCELARVKRDRPEVFKKVLRTVQQSPDLTVENVRTLANTAIADRNGAKGERWVNMEFLLREEDAAVVRQALQVEQALTPAPDPDSEYALGRHLKAICDEYLTGEEARKVWKKLDKAGAFTGSAFKLEQ